MTGKPTLYEVVRDRPGRLATMACPRGGDWLSDEVDALRNAGVDVLVNALTDSEIAERQLAAESELVAGAGMIHLPFPIADRGVPTVGAASELVAQLRQYLEEDRFVVAHCRAGIGRSSLIAAAVLVREGLSPGEAWRRIEGARGLVVPDTEGQKEWLTAFGRR